MIRKIGYEMETDSARQITSLPRHRSHGNVRTRHRGLRRLAVLPKSSTPFLNVTGLPPSQSLLYISSITSKSRAKSYILTYVHRYSLNQAQGFLGNTGVASPIVLSLVIKSSYNRPYHSVKQAFQQPSGIREIGKCHM